MEDGKIPPHFEILEQLQQNYYCKICNELLISAKVLDCGHIFCTYCLDLLPSLSCTCPTCSTRIKTAIPLAQIDAKIDTLVRLLPPPFQFARARSKSERNEKLAERSQALVELKESLVPKMDSQNNLQQNLQNNLHTRNYEQPFSFFSGGNNLDQICSSILNSTGVGVALGDKSANFLPELNNCAKNGKIPPQSARAQMQGDAIRSRPKSVQKNGQNRKLRIAERSNRGSLVVNLAENDREIDLESAEQGLFGIYDDFLDLNSQNSQLLLGVGAGDNISAQEVENFAQNFSQDSRILKMKDKDRSEIENLLEEAEGLIELDAFVKNWSTQLKSQLEEDPGQEDINDSGEKVGYPLDEGLLQRMRHLQDRSVAAAAAANSGPEVKNGPLSLEWKKSADQELEDLDKHSRRKFKDEEESPKVTDYDVALQSLKSHLGLEDQVAKSAKFPQTARDRGANNRGRGLSNLGHDEGVESLRSCQSARQRKDGRERLVSLTKFRPEVQIQESSTNFVQNTATFCRKLDDCKTALVHLKNSNIANSRPEGIRELLPTKECKTARLAHDFRTDCQKPRLQPRPNQRQHLPPIDLDAKNTGNRDLKQISTPRSKNEPLPRLVSLPYPSSNLKGSLTSRGSGPMSTSTPRDFEYDSIRQSRPRSAKGGF